MRAHTVWIDVYLVDVWFHHFYLFFLEESPPNRGPAEFPVSRGEPAQQSSCHFNWRQRFSHLNVKPNRTTPLTGHKRTPSVFHNLPPSLSPYFAHTKDYLQPLDQWVLDQWFHIRFNRIHTAPSLSRTINLKQLPLQSTLHQSQLHPTAHTTTPCACRRAECGHVPFTSSASGLQLTIYD